jgi:hypothetical protein
MTMRRARSLLAVLALAMAIVPLPPPRAAGQEVVGRRVFSDQLVISEPFVEDELSLPSIFHIRRPGLAGHSHTRSTEIEAEVKKRLTTNLELSLAGA